MIGSDQHVLPTGQDWAVKCATCEKPSRIYNDRLRAVIHAEKTAARHRGMVVLHDETGEVESSWHPVYKYPKQKFGSFWDFFIQ